MEEFNWSPSLGFRARILAAPSFNRPGTFSVPLISQVEVYRATERVDFVFPAPTVEEQTAAITPPSLTEDWTLAPDIEVYDLGTQRADELVEVSRDLFDPLGRPSRGGKRYSAKSDEPHQQGDLFDSPSSESEEGYRQSFTELSSERTGASARRKKMSVWDQILPLLEAPVDYNFEQFIGLPYDLRPFQVEGVRFLANQESALLGDDMGIGKTVQTIVAMRLLFQTGEVQSALIVVPRSVLKNWDREIRKWAPTLTGVTVVYGRKQKRKLQWRSPAHVWVTTYGVVRNDLEQIKEYRGRLDLVVLDEIQYIKNADAQRSQAAKQLPRDRAWGLSGTPIENSIDDLGSIFEFLRPGLLPQEDISASQARRAIKPFFLRRRKQDVLDELPEKEVKTTWVALTGNQRETYQKAEQEGIVYLEDLEDEVTVQHVLALLQKLKQICNRDPRSGESAKLEWLEDRLDDAVARDSKALIFSHYVDEGVLFLEEELSEYNPAVVTGEKSQRERERAVHRFQNHSECKLFLATQKAGGVGLNLVRGNYVFHFDHWWNPATARQAEDRAHRIGQERDVFVYHLWTANTVEERVRRILERKHALYSSVIDSLSTAEDGGLTEKELFGLFDLSPVDGGASEDEQGRQAVELGNLSAQEFERTVRRLYSAWGFNAFVTQESYDEGVDVVAERKVAGSGVEKYAIQCKRFRKERSVGVSDVRELLGVLSHDTSYTKGVVITTATFSRGAKRLAENRGNLELINRSRLERHLVDQGVEVT